MMRKRIRITPEYVVYLCLWPLLMIMPVSIFYLRAKADMHMEFRWEEVFHYLEVVSVVSCLLFHPQFLPGTLAASKALEGLFSLYVKSALYFHRNIRSYA